LREKGEPTMKRLAIGLMGAFLGTAGLGHAFANEAKERGTPIEESNLPTAVKSTFDKEAKGGQVEELRRDMRKNGKVVYTGEVVKNGKGTDLEVSEQGKVLHRGKSHDESKEKGEHKTEQK